MKSLFPCRIVMSLLCALALELKAMELNLDTLPRELIENVASFCSESPSEYLSRLAMTSSVNKALNEMLSSEAILAFFYRLYHKNIAIKISKKTGDTIMHVLAKFNKYELLHDLIDKCKNDKHRKIFKTFNNNYEVPLLALLIHKKGNAIEKDFDAVFSLLLEERKNNKVSKTYTSHTHMLRSCEIMSKLSDEQKKRLEYFGEQPTKCPPKISKIFSCAITGDCKYFLKRRVPFTPSLEFKKCGYWEETPLHVAARNGHVAFLKSLLSTEKGKKHIEHHNVMKATPLIRAARGGSVPCIELLLESKADIDAKDQNGFTAIMEAARSGHLPAVAWLLNRNAKVDILSKKKTSILETAEFNGNSEITEYLLSHDFPKEIEGVPLCILAAKINLPKLIEKLVKHGHDIEYTCKRFSSTALMFAAQAGHTECVKKLLKLGASINRKNIKGYSVFYFTCDRSFNNNCVHKNKSLANEISVILAEELARKAKEVDFYDLAEAYVVMEKNGFHDGAAILRGCINSK